MKLCDADNLLLLTLFNTIGIGYTFAGLVMYFVWNVKGGALFNLSNMNYIINTVFGDGFLSLHI